MKQKRKVKSLLSQKKDLNGGFMTALLLALGLALCLGSATLMTTSSVGAAGVQLSSLTYSGIDDKVEVLYNLQFSKPDNLSGIVGEMFTDKNNDFYITSSIPLIVNLENPSANDNVVGTGLYSNILGGLHNNVQTNNITIIGGENNGVASRNNNSVILGGNGDGIIGNSVGNIPSVIVGGKNNKIFQNHNGDTIIGGESNIIGDGISNSFILGGKSNEVYANDVIVGGSNVKVSTGKVFVFSNYSTQFEPQSSNAFYLNLAGGIGINTSSAGIGVTVNGPVRFGSIDITNTTQYPCNSDNYGMIGVWNVGSHACLVGCTASSAPEGGAQKWDLLDRGEECRNHCFDYEDYCAERRPEEDGGPVHYNDSFCTTGDTEIVDVSNASPCTPVWDQIENVVFETSLIDAADVVACPANAANKCIYQCNTGYHLTGDTTGKFPSNAGSIEKCFKDCDLVEILGGEWVATGTNGVIKHNQTVVAYNKDVVPCSYDAYRYNPITRTNANPTGYHNARGYYLDNGYGTKWYRSAKGIGLDNANGPYYRYELPETCTNNAHKQILVCVNGEMYIASGNKTTGKLATGGGYLGDNYLGYAHSGYIHMDCNTSAYTCNTGQYNLEETYIINNLYDTGITIKPSNPKDRKEIKGIRGKYKLCLDYIQDPANNKECKINTPTAAGNAGAYDNYYEFKGCNTSDGYWPTERTGGNSRYEGTPDDSRVCRKQCTFRTRDGVNVTKRDLYEITLYNVNSGSCLAIDNPDEIVRCMSKTFKCDDGTWRDLSGNDSLTEMTNDYSYSKCKQNGNACADHWVSTGTYEAHKDDEISVYVGPCHRMHAKDSPYPNTSNGGPWNRRYRNDTGAQFHDFGDPRPVQRPCEDNDWWYKLDHCVNKCYHGTGLKESDKPNNYMQYCEADFIDIGECSVTSNYKKQGYNYKLWIGVFNTGNWVDGTCSYYCDKGTYEKDGACVDNPTRVLLSYDSNTQYLLTETESIPNGTGYTDIIYDRVSGNEIQRGEQYVSCKAGYHQVNKACKTNTQNCVGDLPYNAKYKSYRKGTTSDGSVMAWKWTSDGAGDCKFTCKDGYRWNGITCVEDCGEDDDLCTIHYDQPTGRNVSETERTVKCGRKVVLAEASKKCYYFDGWYKGGNKIVPDAHNEITLNEKDLWVTPKEGSYNEYEQGCAYTCVGGDAPHGGNDQGDLHIEINDNPGTNTDKEWMFVEGYNNTLQSCQWQCKWGYMRGTGTKSQMCVEKPCLTGAGHDKPTGSTIRKLKDTYVGTGVYWTYTGTTTQNATQPDNNTPDFNTTQNKEKCLWTCKAGYTRSGSTCVKRTCYTSSSATARSTTLVPTIAHSRQGTGLFNVVSNLYWTGVSGSNPGACQWVCDSGYTRLKTSTGCQNTCVPIHTGQCMSDGSKRVGNTNRSGYCFTGFHSAITTSGNTYIWNCVSNNSGSVCYPNDPGRVGATAQNCYRCKKGYTGSACKEIRNASCNNEVELGCKYTGVTAQTSDTDGVVDYEDDSEIYWHCNGKNDGTSTSTYSCRKCKYGYRLNPFSNECELINDRCGDAPGMCEDDEHAEMTEGARIDGVWVDYYNSSKHEYTWRCQQRVCQMCDVDNGYNLKDKNESSGKKCMKCNNCAKNGWPYCFPIDFSPYCEENDYTDLDG